MECDVIGEMMLEEFDKQYISPTYLGLVKNPPPTSCGVWEIIKEDLSADADAESVSSCETELRFFLSKFFSKDVTEEVLATAAAMKNSALGTLYFFREGFGGLGLRVLRDIQDEVDESLNTVQDVVRTHGTEGKARGSQRGELSVKEKLSTGGGYSDASFSSGGSGLGGAGGSGSGDAGGSGVGGLELENIQSHEYFTEVIQMDVSVPLFVTPEKNERCRSRTISERSSLFISNFVIVEQQFIPDDRNANGYVHLFHGLWKKSWESFCTHGIHPLYNNNEFSSREAFYVSNSVRHAYEHPVHVKTRENAQDTVYILVFQVPIQVLQANDTNDFKVKIFNSPNENWVHFCKSNMRPKHGLRHHDWDFVIGPTCIPAPNGVSLPLRVDQKLVTQVACCSSRTWDFFNQYAVILLKEVRE